MTANESFFLERRATEFLAVQEKTVLMLLGLHMLMIWQICHDSKSPAVLFVEQNTTEQKREMERGEKPSSQEHPIAKTVPGGPE